MSRLKHSVVLVDQHPVTYTGIVALINRSADFEVCALASTRTDCFRCMQTTNPDLIVMDIAIGDMDGFELIRHFTRMLPDAPILVFSALEEPAYAPRVYRAGAQGFLPKTAAPEELLHAMRAILAGQNYFRDPALSAPRHALPPSLLDLLSDRELELFRFLGKGYPTGRIAEAMQLSEHTVNAYRVQIKKKLHLDDFSMLIRQAIAWEDVQH